MVNFDKYMRQCITLAKKAQGKTSPNPLVGCVVLNKDGKVVSTGYHKKYGQNHAERDALLKLKNGEEAGGTLIVNLEPCSHFGKTPPCADLIIERKLSRVVVGTFDTNKIATGGIKKLKDAGLEVITDVLSAECRDLNEVFFTNIEQKRTFVALKTATTIDGKIATKTGNSKWITSDKSRNYGKKLRSYYDAILTSSNTVLADNPTMKHDIKVILDKDFRTHFDANIYSNGKIYLVISNSTSISNIPENVEVIKSPLKNNNIDLSFVLEKLFNKGIMSVFVETGEILSGEFIKENLVDKIYHFVAPKILNDNKGKSCFSADNATHISDSKIFNLSNVKQLGNDVLLTYRKLL